MKNGGGIILTLTLTHTLAHPEHMSGPDVTGTAHPHPIYSHPPTPHHAPPFDQAESRTCALLSAARGLREKYNDKCMFGSPSRALAEP